MLASDYYELKGNSPTHDTDADPFDSGSGCTLDGVPFDCNSAIGLVNQGAAFYAPLKSIEAIYNREQRKYTGFAIFDPSVGEFTRLTQIRPKKNPPVLIRRNGTVSPSDPGGGNEDDDSEFVVRGPSVRAQYDPRADFRDYARSFRIRGGKGATTIVWR